MDLVALEGLGGVCEPPAGRLLLALCFDLSVILGDTGADSLLLRRIWLGRPISRPRLVMGGGDAQYSRSASAAASDARCLRADSLQWSE